MDSLRPVLRVAGLMAAVAIPGLALIPLETLQRIPALCLFQLLFRWECPGCGMTRALCAALHGDLAAAWNFNRLFVVVLPSSVALAAWQVGALIWGAFQTVIRRIPLPKITGHQGQPAPRTVRPAEPARGRK